MEVLIGAIVVIITILFFNWLKKSNADLNDYYPLNHSDIIGKIVDKERRKK